VIDSSVSLDPLSARRRSLHIWRVAADIDGEPGGNMLNAGPAKKVTIYVGQDQKYHGESVYAAILEFLFYRKVSGATVTRGVAGFGADHHMQTDRILVL